MSPTLIPRTAKVELDGSGNGLVTFAIDNSNQRWSVGTVNVQVTDVNGNQLPNSSPVPTANTYFGQVSPNGWRGGTQNGNLDTGVGGADLYAGDTLIVVFTGGAPGTWANATIGGTFDGAGARIDD